MPCLGSRQTSLRYKVSAGVAIAVHAHPPIAQSAEAVDLKSIKCGFESHWGDIFLPATLFTDSSLASFDADATALLLERFRGFLAAI